jgi:hypothetical protein
VCVLSSWLQVARLLQAEDAFSDEEGDDTEAAEAAAAARVERELDQLLEEFAATGDPV